MAETLKERAAVVTGAGRGIGRAIAIAFAKEGASVVVVDPGTSRDGKGTDSRPADEVVEEIIAEGGKAIADYNSVTDFDGAEQTINTCVNAFGKIDIVVNCAGILRERMIFNMTEEDWDAVINVHLKGTFNICRHACVKMREQCYGRIVNFASDAWRGTVGQCNYGAAKGGIVSLGRAIAREMGKYGVTANSIAPFAATRMTLNEKVKAGLKKRLEKGLITQEYYNSALSMPGPEVIAPVIVYLASENTADINGQIFHIEKGKVSTYYEPIENRAICKAEDNGIFTVEELNKHIPSTLMAGYFNPAPADPKKISK